MSGLDSKAEHRHPDERRHVVIAGGGPAAIEAVLALRELAGERTRLTLISAEAQFLFRPSVVVEPFSGPRARSYSLPTIADDLDIEFKQTTVREVNAQRRVVLTDDGAVSYDLLLVALGARPAASYEHAVNIDYSLLDHQLHGLVQDVEIGSTTKVAFLVPPAPCWFLPLYELALMTADRAYEMNIDPEVTIVTPEPAPLAVFGTVGSEAVKAALDHRRVAVVSNSTARVTDDARLFVEPGARELKVDRIVALPELFGPALPGLPSDERGFIPVGPHCEVRDIPGVFAAGDATDVPVKQGGIATQEAVAAAESIARAVGIQLEPQPFHPVMHAIMFGPHPPLYLRSRLVDGQAVDSDASNEPLWSPPSKIDSRYLAPYLAQLDARGAS